MPRPAYLEPKLTDDDRIEIRRLRADDKKTWTQQALAEKFNVNRSTIDRILHKTLAVPFDKVHRHAIITAEATGQIPTPALFELKRQQWHRQLLTETNLAKQQQLVNLIKSAWLEKPPEKPKTGLQALDVARQESDQITEVLSEANRQEAEQERQRLIAIRREENRANMLHGLDQAILANRRRHLLGTLNDRVAALGQAEPAADDSTA